MKIILIADQPFQLHLFSELSSSLIADGYETKIVLADFFTFIYGKEYIEDRQLVSGSQILTFEEPFKRWQLSHYKLIDNAQALLKNWELAYCKNRSLDQILKTDPYTNGYEFEAFYLTIDSDVKIPIYADIVALCEDIYRNEKPDLLISIDNALLPTNVFFTMAEKEETPFITFTNARIGERWVARKDFAYGMNYDFYQSILNKKYSSEVNNQALDIVREYKNLKSHLYESHSVIVKKANANKNLRTIRSFLKFVKELFIWAKYSVKTILLGPRSRNFKVNILDQSFSKLIFFEFRRRFTPYFARNSSLFINTAPVGSNYFFWALHFRPEGSGLVLGDGNDEIVYLKKVADLIPSDFALFVKENPEMYGLRSKDFYVELSNHPKIILIDPYLDTKSYILGACAVLGVSGTILLEAILLGIPAWAFGKPEFLLFLSGNGWDDFESFLDRITNGLVKVNTFEILQYVCYLIENSSSLDIALHPKSDPKKMQGDILRMKNIITSELLNVANKSIENK